APPTPGTYTLSLPTLFRSLHGEIVNEVRAAQLRVPGIEQQDLDAQRLERLLRFQELDLAASGTIEGHGICVKQDAHRRTPFQRRSEEHTSELQSLRHLVCR